MNVTQLSALMGVSREAVRLWTMANPPVPRRDDGTFVVAEVVTWRIQRAVEAEREKIRDDEKPKTQSEMNRKLSVEADLKELQLEQMRGTLVPIELHQEIIGKISGGFAAVAAGRLARYERAIVQAKSAADARRLTQQIHIALMEGAQDFADELDEEAAAEAEPAA